jgi:hypothetical protein
MGKLGYKYWHIARQAVNHVTGRRDFSSQLLAACCSANTLYKIAISYTYYVYACLRGLNLNYRGYALLV